MNNTNFLDFWSKLFLRPKEFFSKYEPESFGKPPFFIFTIIIFCIGVGIEGVERLFTKYDLRDNLESLELLNEWPLYLCLVIVIGTLGGMLQYALGSWFFNLRLKWSEGPDDIQKSKFIYLYSGFVTHIVTVSLTIVSVIYYGKPYNTGEDINALDIIVAVLSLFSVYYSVYVSYSGVCTIEETDKLRRALWFLVLPMLAYTLVYVSIIILVVFAFLE